MSEWGWDLISCRTRAVLGAAKARGVKLGTTGPADLRRHLDERTANAVAFSERMRELLAGLRAVGLSQRAVVERLNKLGIAAPRGSAWSVAQLQRVLGRLSRADDLGAHPQLAAHPGTSPA